MNPLPGIVRLAALLLPAAPCSALAQTPGTQPLPRLPGPRAVATAVSL
jgi:hypothetical protein